MREIKGAGAEQSQSEAGTARGAQRGDRERKREREQKASYCKTPEAALSQSRPHLIQSRHKSM